MYLNDLSSKLRSPVLQVMSIDGEYSVIAAQSSILCSQPPLQQVKNKNAWLIGPSYEFNAELFSRVPFVEDHVEDLFPWRAAVGVAVCSVPKAPLSQHGELHRSAGLGEGGSGVVVRYVADVTVVDLEEKKYDPSVTIFYLLNLKKRLYTISKRN